MAQAEAQSYLVEALAGIVMLKASGAEDRLIDAWTRLFHRYRGAALERSELAARVESGYKLRTARNSARQGHFAPPTPAGCGWPNASLKL